MRPYLAIITFACLLAIIAIRSRPAVPPLFPKFMGVASPPLSVADELKSFRLAQADLKIECAASEPMIEAPVAAQFDERGRLWVVEMRTYMPDVEGTGELEHRNRISILEDLNRDGIFDTSTIFMDDLVLPRAVAPCFDGALVIEPPNLLFCRDTNGDGKADERTILATGFAGLESPEHAGNGLLYGIDGWYHLSQHKEEFRISRQRATDGRSVPHIETRATPNHGQWGLTHDTLGRNYYTPNSNPLIVDLYPKFWAARNPHMAGASGLGVDIAPGVCWPIHPTPGANRGYQEGSLRADKTLASVTAACGPTILNDSLLGEQFRGNAFLCDAVGNLVKRLILTETDSGPRAKNAYDKKEFLASTDERFRPVNTVEGPDGSLYILDMYRGVIQHKTFATNYLKEQYKKRNLETPLNMGRIYRIAPSVSAQRQSREFAGTSAADLARSLIADDWYAAHAQRIILERHETGVLTALHLSRLQPGGISPRVLWTLEGLGDLWESDCLESSGAALRAALELCIIHIKEPRFADAFRTLTSRSKDPSLAPIIAAGWAALGDNDRLFWFLDTVHENAAARAAALCFLKDRELSVLRALLQSRGTESRKNLIGDLFSCCLRSSPQVRSEVLAYIASLSPELRHPLLDRLASDIKLGTPFPKPLQLAQEPAEFLRLGGDPRLAAITDQFTWPGHALKTPPVRPLTDEEQSRFERGSFLYHSCTTCHQPDGRGAPGQAPALAGSAYVNGPPERPVKILLNGLQGPYEINGQRYEGAMPVPPGVGSDQDIAAILTYVRRSFGNTADPVDQQTVAKVRKQTLTRYKSWTRPELDRAN